jgi:hypothetical protein
MTTVSRVDGFRTVARIMQLAGSAFGRTRVTVFLRYPSIAILFFWYRRYGEIYFNGNAVAFVRRLSRQQSHSVSLISTVAARPTGCGHGTRLMSRICSDADRCGRVLRLEIPNAASQSFYCRFGFDLEPKRSMSMVRVPQAVHGGCGSDPVGATHVGDPCLAGQVTGVTEPVGDEAIAGGSVVPIDVHDGIEHPPVGMTTSYSRCPANGGMLTESRSRTHRP